MTLEHKDGVIADMQRSLLDKVAEIAALRKENSALQEMLVEQAKSVEGYERSFLDASLGQHLRAWWRKVW